MDNQQPISLDASPQVAPISLDTGTGFTPVNPDVAAKRATKASAALGPTLGKSKDEIQSTISSGNEDAFRQAASAGVDFSNLQTRQKFLTQAAQTASPEQFAALARMGIPKSDPNSVIEDNYSKWFLGSSSVKDQGDPIVGFREYMNTQAENADAKVHTQGWGSWLADQAKTAIPFYYQARMRAQASDLKTAFAGLQGSELAAQADELWSDPNTAKQKFDKVMDNLKDNPSLQSSYAHAMLGQTRSEEFLNNAFSTLDFSTLPGAVKFGSGIATRAFALNRDARAIRDAIAAANTVNDGLPGAANSQGGLTSIKVNGVERPDLYPTTPIPNDINVAKASIDGDLGKSAEAQAALDLTNKFTNKAQPLVEAVQGLPTNLRLDRNTVEAGGAGRVGSDIVNRIKQDYDTTESDVNQVLQNTMRVNETPVNEAAPDVVARYKQYIKDTYRGPNNTLIDVKNPEWDAPTNTYSYKMVIGNENGEYFDTPQLARNKAKLYGYPLETTVRADVNERVGKELTELDYKISTLQKEMKIPPEMEADVNELNRHADMPRQLDALMKQREDAMAYQAENSIGPDIKVPGNKLGMTIGQHGTKYYIEVNVPQNNTNNIIRDGLIPLPNSFSGAARKGTRFGTQVPGLKGVNDDYNTWENIKTTIAWMRTPGETLSPEEVNQRVVATHGAASYLKVAQDNAKIINEIPNRYRKDFNRVLTANQSMPDPHTGERGYYFETIPELEDQYRTQIGRAPTPEETRGYFAVVRNWEYDRILRSLLGMHNKLRNGVMDHQIRIKDSAGNDANSSYFNGVVRNELPGGTDNIVVMGDTSDQYKMYRGDSVQYARVRNKLAQDVKEGRKQVVEVYDVDARPLQAMLKDGRAVRYVVTNKINTRPIQFGDQVPRRGGGHWDYNYDFSVKQANMINEKVGGNFRDRYEGDTLAAFADNEAVGRDFVKHLEEIRKRLDAGDIKGAEAYNNAHFHENWKDTYAKFKGKKGPNGEDLPPTFSTKEPFRVVPMGKTINSMDNDLVSRYKDTFYDATKQGSLARTQQVQYTGPRDSEDPQAIRVQGTRNNPVFNYIPANLVDPMTTMDRALSRIVNSSFMEHYQIMGAEHWLQNASKWLIADGSKDPEAALRYAPFYYFKNFNPENSFKPGTPDEVRRLLTNNWKKINDFVGIPSATDRFINKAGQQLANSMYKVAGVIIPTKDLPHARNPLQFFRSATFLGTFWTSPATFFTQFSTFVNVFAIQSPRYAASTTFGMLMHQMSRVNSSDPIIKAMGKMGEHFGWRPGEWEEARSALLNWSNFYHVGSEHAMLDSFVANHTITNAATTAKDVGMSFFRAGAENTRVASFYSAFKEFKDLNPTKSEFSRLDKEWVLNRAADLDHNMSRAFNSSLHTGGMSFFGQFYAYSMRLAELMTGKRLNTWEKTRLFAVSSLMWGIPMGGAGLFGFPFGDIIRKEAVTQGGYNPGQNFWSTLGMEGVPAVLHAFVSGGAVGDLGKAADALFHGQGAETLRNLNEARTAYQKGNWYDYSKFGTKGVDPFLDFLEGDKTLWDIFGGATVSKFHDAWKQSSGIIAWMAGQLEGNGYKLTFQDLISPLKEISIVNAEEKLRYALRTHKNISKNGTYLSDVDAAGAWFMAATGIQQTKVVDAAILSKASGEQKSYDDWATNNYIKEYNRANDALLGDPINKAEHEVHAKNAQVWLDKIPHEKQTEALARARASLSPLTDRARYNFYLGNDIPPGQEQSRRDTWNAGRALDKMRGQ